MSYNPLSYVNPTGVQSMNPDAGSTLDAWAMFLGPVAAGRTPINGGGYSYQHENPPADRTLHNGFLGTLVYGLILDSMPEILFTVLPVREIKTLTFQYDTMYFSTPMATVVPYEAAGRLVTHSFSSGSGTMLRRGVGMLMDIETMQSAFGVNMFNAQLQQIKNVVHLTLIGDILYALLASASNPDNKRRYFEQHKVADNEDSMVDHEIVNYAAIVKNPAAGMKTIMKNLNVYAKQNGFSYNAILCGDDLLQYAQAMTSPSEYVIEAYGASETRTSTVTQSIEGVPVYAIPSLNIYQDTAVMPDVNSHVQIGEFYLAADPKRASQNNEFVVRDMRERAIMLYNENNDCWEEIELLLMLQYCHRFDEKGNLHPAHDEIAKNSKNMDLFLTKDDNGYNHKVQVFGEMEDMYLDRPTIGSVARSMLGRLTSEDRSNVNALVQLYEAMLQSAPIAPDTQNHTPQDRMITPGYPGTTPVPGKAAGAGANNYNVTANVAAQLRFYVRNSNAGDNFYSVDELRERCESLEASQIRYAGYLTNWYGLELMAMTDENVRAQVQSFLRYYDAIKSALGDEHPFVDPERCPENLKHYVMYPGPCTLFETVFGYTTTPILGLKVNAPAIESKPVLTMQQLAELIQPELVPFQEEKIPKTDKTYYEYFFDVLTIHTELQKKSSYLLQQEGVNPKVAPFLQNAAYKFMKDAHDSRTNLRRFINEQHEKDDTYQAIKNILELNEKLTVQQINTINDLSEWPTQPDSHDFADHPANLSNDELVISERALLPIVFSSKRSAAWRTAFKGQGTNKLVEGFIFTIFKPQDSFLVPLSITANGAIDENEFNATMAQLAATKQYMHRMARIALSEKFSPAHEIEKEDKMEVSESIRNQKRISNVKRGRIDVHDLESIGVPPPNVYRRQLPAFVHRYHQLASTSDPAVRGAMFAFLTAPITRGTLVKMISAGCCFPFNFLLFRLTDVHYMAGALIVQGGTDTGACFFGLQDWTAGISPEQKLFYANYTFHSKAVVFRNERVTLVPALSYLGYLGGHNNTMMDSNDIQKWSSQKWQVTQQDLMEAEVDRASICVCLTSYVEIAMRKFIDASGYRPTANKDTSNPDYASAHYYGKMYGFDRINSKDKEYGYGLYRRDTRPTTLAVQGPIRVWTDDGLYDVNAPFSRVGQGHHGREIHEGSTGRIRKGLLIAQESKFVVARGP